MDFVRPPGFCPTANPVNLPSFQISFWLFSIKVLSSAREGESTLLFSKIEYSNFCTEGYRKWIPCLFAECLNFLSLKLEIRCPSWDLPSNAIRMCENYMKGWTIHLKDVSISTTVSQGVTLKATYRKSSKIKIEDLTHRLSFLAENIRLDIRVPNETKCEHA